MCGSYGFLGVRAWDARSSGAMKISYEVRVAHVHLVVGLPMTLTSWSIVLVFCISLIFPARLQKLPDDALSAMKAPHAMATWTSNK